MTAIGFADEMPEVMRLIEHPPIDFVRIRHPMACAWAKIDDDNLRVIISESVESDGRRWLHVTRCPTSERTARSDALIPNFCSQRRDPCP